MPASTILKRVSSSSAAIRNPRAHEAFRAVVLDQPPHAICLSVGGGPLVVHPRLLNLNLHPFPNVHLVGTAYCLPIADGSVNAIYCEAVLEHLEYPDLAVKEMARVLRPNGQVLAVTPLLQPYHAYPDHYQNFTLTGHSRLFERAGFQVCDSGPCTGPTFAILDLWSNYLREYIPSRLLSRLAFYCARLCGSVVAHLDRRLLNHPQAHVLASTTFVHAKKSTAPSALVA